MDYQKITKALQGEPVFRLNQAKRAIFRDLIEDWHSATTLALAWREKLAGECPLEIKAEVFVSKDGRSAKALITLEDGAKVETVLMRHQGIKSKQDRNTICVSSQIGCPLECVFCATGQLGFKRNLTAGEIIEQVLFWGRWLKNDCGAINNVVFMGMGEPFLNYDNVMAAIKIINDKDAFNIGSRHISVSTVGIVEGINKFALEPLQANLAISLHAPDDGLRTQLMPVNKQYPLGEVLSAAVGYIKKTNRKLMFEYLMIKDFNDSEACAKKLAALLKELPQHLIMVNLISYNQTGVFSPSPAAQIKKFKNILMKANIQAIERFRFGQDIKGACGQLAGLSIKKS